MKCTWIFHKGQILCPSPKQIVWQSSSWSESNQCSDASYFHCHSSLCKLQPPQTTSFTRTGIHDCMDILIECGCMIICTHTYIYICKYTYDTDTYIYIYTHRYIYIYTYITCIYTNIHLRHCFFCCLPSPKYRYYTSVCLDTCAMKSPCLASCLPSIKQVWDDQYSQPQNPRNRTWCAYIAHKTNLQVHVHITCV